jgi:cell division protein FtsI/penicillin-binding protein 2
MQVPDNTNSRATADIIFTGGQIHTVNVQNDIVEAVAVGGGRILAMGSTPTFDPSPVLGHAKSSCTGPRSCPASLTPTATSPASA